jgi:hypothetical protein
MLNPFIEKKLHFTLPRAEMGKAAADPAAVYIHLFQQTVFSGTKIAL